MAVAIDVILWQFLVEGGHLVIHSANKWFNNNNSSHDLVIIPDWQVLFPDWQVTQTSKRQHTYHGFHETCHYVTFIVLVNSHQRWKQTRNRVCFHLWCELTLAELPDWIIHMYFYLKYTLNKNVAVPATFESKIKLHSSQCAFSLHPGLFPVKNLVLGNTFAWFFICVRTPCTLKRSFVIPTQKKCYFNTKINTFWLQFSNMFVSAFMYNTSTYLQTILLFWKCLYFITLYQKSFPSIRLQQIKNCASQL